MFGFFLGVNVFFVIFFSLDINGGVGVIIIEFIYIFFDILININEIFYFGFLVVLFINVLVILFGVGIFNILIGFIKINFIILWLV